MSRRTVVVIVHMATNTSHLFTLPSSWMISTGTSARNVSSEAAAGPNDFRRREMLAPRICTSASRHSVANCLQTRKMLELRR